MAGPRGIPGPGHGLTRRSEKTAAYERRALARAAQRQLGVVLLFGSSEPEARRSLVPPEIPMRLGHFHFPGPANAKNERSFSLVSRRRVDSVRTNAQSSP